MQVVFSGKKQKPARVRNGFVTVEDGQTNYLAGSGYMVHGVLVGSSKNGLWQDMVTVLAYWNIQQQHPQKNDACGGVFL